MLFSPDGDRIHACLWLAGFTTPQRSGRLRDGWLEIGDDGQPRVAIYTRNGGGNREECGCLDTWTGKPRGVTEPEWFGDEGCPCLGFGGPACTCTACCANDRMPENPLHLYGEDDEFDGTYRTEYFRFRELPADLSARLREAAGPQVDTSERWAALIAGIEASS